MMNPYVLLAALALYVATAVGGFFFGEHVKSGEVAQAQVGIVTQAMDAKDKAQQDVRDVSAGYQQVVAYQNQQIAASERKWKNALQKPVYVDCRPDADGLHLLNDRIDEANLSRRLGSSLPGNPATAGRLDDGRSDGRAPNPGQSVFGLRPPARPIGGSGQ